MPVDAVDLAGAVMGVVEYGEELGPHRVRDGDVVIALRSPNLRSNGFSLIRSVLGDEVGQYFDILLEPSVIYAPAVLAAVEGGGVHAAAHITGGGIVGNLARALREGTGATIDTTTWEPPEVFATISSVGVSRDEMFTTFNMGMGFCLVVDRTAVPQVLEATASHAPWEAGVVSPGNGVTLR
jgi:phosphoribosylformylglycinamidine cyclo-ligase